MKQYLDLINNILENGDERIDRTNVGTKAIFGGQLKFDLRERFPLVTIKKTLWKSAFHEMLWFLSGKCDNLKYLHDNNIHIWDEWADDNGNLGPIYGVQWRAWKDYHPYSKKVIPIDQIELLINNINNNSTNRRLIVSGWNVAELDLMALPPCHRDFQCFVSSGGDLDLMMSQRSVDVMLGLPFNICQYALLTHLIARATNTKPRFLMINYGDAHIYSNHIETVKQIINNPIIDCPTRLLIKSQNTNIDQWSIDDFDVEGYPSTIPFIKFPIAV